MAGRCLYKTLGISMRRFATMMPMLALTLAAVLPLAQAHCAFMRTPGPDRLVSMIPASAGGPASVDHSCCTLPKSDAPPSTDKGCPCLQIPPATLSAAVTLVAPSPGGLVAMLPAASPVVMPHRATMRITDSPGTPPNSSILVDPHPLRGPPSFLPLS